MVMVQFARACAITVSEFRRRCRIVSSILSSLLKTKDWEWVWQLHVRFLNRTAAPSRGKTPMVVGLNSNLSFRSPHHLHDACEKPLFLINDDASVRKAVFRAIALGRL